jgi:hypothetical protein
MSVRGGGCGVIVEIDPPGTTIPRRGVVPDAYEAKPERERERIKEARRLKKNRR